MKKTTYSKAKKLNNIFEERFKKLNQSDRMEILHIRDNYNNSINSMMSVIHILCGFILSISSIIFFNFAYASSRLGIKLSDIVSSITTNNINHYIVYYIFMLIGFISLFWVPFILTSLVIRDIKVMEDISDNYLIERGIN